MSLAAVPDEPTFEELDAVIARCLPDLEALGLTLADALDYAEFMSSVDGDGGAP